MPDPDSKLSKKQVHYTPKGIAQDVCSRCVHFVPKNACTMVEGRIDRMAWCDRFIKRAPREGRAR